MKISNPFTKYGYLFFILALLIPILSFASINDDDKPNADKLIVHSYMLIKKSAPSSMDEKISMNKARDDISYYINGFDYSIASKEGVKLTRIQSKSTFQSERISSESIKVPNGCLMKCSFRLSKKKNISKSVLKDMSLCIKKKVTVNIDRREMMLGVRAQALQKALFIIYRDQLKNTEKKKAVTGHAYIHSISSVKHVKKDNRQFFQVEIELLMPAVAKTKKAD